MILHFPAGARVILEVNERCGDFSPVAAWAPRTEAQVEALSLAPFLEIVSPSGSAKKGCCTEEGVSSLVGQLMRHEHRQQVMMISRAGNSQQVIVPTNMPLS